MLTANEAREQAPERANRYKEQIRFYYLDSIDRQILDALDKDKNEIFVNVSEQIAEELSKHLTDLGYNVKINASMTESILNIKW